MYICHDSFPWTPGDVHDLQVLLVPAKYEKMMSKQQETFISFPQERALHRCLTLTENRSWRAQGATLPTPSRSQRNDITNGSSEPAHRATSHWHTAAQTTQETALGLLFSWWRGRLPLVGMGDKIRGYVNGQNPTIITMLWEPGLVWQLILFRDTWNSQAYRNMVKTRRFHFN